MLVCFIVLRFARIGDLFVLFQNINVKTSEMREFGSDFHFCNDIKRGLPFSDYFPKVIYYACGRQALLAVLERGKYRRVWFPRYFCYDVIDYICQTGIKVSFYNDFPGNQDDDDVIDKLNLQVGDVLLRMNYFGTRSWRDNSRVPVPVIEDHSHDLIGEWSIKSNANWCIASLRKTLPIAEGGVLWSPVGYVLPQVEQTNENEFFSKNRFMAMEMKRRYLVGEDVEKGKFRDVYMATENGFKDLPLSRISTDSLELVQSIGIEEWYLQKKKNWNHLLQACFSSAVCLPLENEQCNPFSLVLLFNSNLKREEVRVELIKRNIYPSVLWNLPENSTGKEIDISKRMLSLHCDGRYTLENMQELRNELEEICN